MPDKTLALIGHSHSVCMLDSLGEWRSRCAGQKPNQDQRYSAAFQGWFESDLSKDKIHLPLQNNHADFARVICLPIFGATSGGDLISPTLLPNGQMEVQLTATFMAYLEEMEAAQVIISTLFGNEHARYVYVDDLPHYDFVPLDEVETELSRDVRPIDRLYIRQILEPFTNKVNITLACIQHKYPTKKIIHLLPPPPLADLATASHLELFAEQFEKHGTVRPQLRLKWYRSYCWLLREKLTATGIIVAAPPADALCREGFLKPEFAEGLTHGNSCYAGKMWQKLVTEHIE